MNENKVIIDLSEYNELRDFKNKTEEGCVQVYCYDRWDREACFMTKDEILIQLNSRIKTLEHEKLDFLKEVSRLEGNLKELKNSDVELKTLGKSLQARFEQQESQLEKTKTLWEYEAKFIAIKELLTINGFWNRIKLAWVVAFGSRELNELIKD